MSTTNVGNHTRTLKWMKILEREHIKKEEKYIKGGPQYDHQFVVWILSPAGAELPYFLHIPNTKIEM
jgi:hypothetical protein